MGIFWRWKEIIYPCPKIAMRVVITGFGNTTTPSMETKGLEQLSRNRK